MNVKKLFCCDHSREKGSFLNFCRALQGRNITEFNYRASDASAAQVFVGISLKGGEKERHDILKHLKTQFDVDDLSDDEVAKLHIRYLIGGHADLENERLFRVEFPERPGALVNVPRTSWPYA